MLETGNKNTKNRNKGNRKEIYPKNKTKRASN